MDRDRLVEMVRREVARTNQADVAREIGVSESTVKRWLAGAPPSKQTRKLVVWAERRAAAYQTAAPPARTVREGAGEPASDYWAGVNYAALAMSETVTRLLREMSDARGVTPSLSGEGLEAMTRRQIAADAAAEQRPASGDE
jgi:transcriptional regulator with XRE-family HTH domain